ncbi:nucleotide exchange factor GrpE [Nocardioides panacisoli]|uniref:nucleotide exchange factor GrpE n=1 Tax=Nocardioides panacisoli TaxID=627624 RepID=UPI001C6308CD|nr:nucleotide exchange factor GrpE [Nocardioides panacisoli]QYJ02927.1 nucleotide exchange factor GrpE [Nocardioides panacisoli]
MTDAEQEPTSPGPDHPGTSGVDDMVEEGAPVEPQDVAAVEEDQPAGGDPVTEAEQALAERTADLQRLQAEYANYRRRVERDREQVRENATFAALTPIVEVLDTIDRAREHGELEGGFKAVADQLERIVADRGLERFGTVGDEFDPTLHEALSHIGTDPEVSVTTCKVIAKSGYRIGDRVVRAAQVLVVDPEEGDQPAPAQSPSGESTQPEEPAEEVVENEE